MRMENIMNYKAFLYIIFVFLSAYAISGLNFDAFIKRNKVIEARLIAIILTIISGYILTNFVTDFLEVSSLF